MLLTVIAILLQLTTAKAQSTELPNGANSMFGNLSPNTLPTVITNAATNVTQSSATLNGHVDANGDSTTVSFQYGLTTSYGSTVSAGTVTGNNMTAVSAGISGLSPATTYHFRAEGTNISGTSYGTDSVFTTSSASPVPTVITDGATNINQTTATLNGRVNANGYLTTVTFQYGLTTSYGSTVSGGTVTGNTLTPVTGPVTGLLPSTTYHFRVTGTNTYGTSNGNDTTFTTLSAAPTVSTGGSSNITSSGATIYDLTTANGLSTSTSFDYGLTTAYGSSITGVPSTVNGNVQTSVSGSLTGLSPSTTYHYRGKAVNSMGTAYGYDSTFTTYGTGQPPTVVTTAATNVALTSATLNGNENANGSTTTASFQYGLTTSYGTTVSAGTVNGNNMTPISAGISGLSPGTLYHFRAVGTNVNGTVYGYDSTFTTSGAAIVITEGASSITQTTANLNGNVNPNGNWTQVNFQYGLTTSYGTTVSGSLINGIEFMWVWVPITGLSPSTTYHFRVTGTTGYGTTYGLDSVFTTLPTNLPPIVVTTGATNVTSSGATLNGSIDANGFTTTASFQYGLTTSYGSTIAAGTVNGNTMTPVSAGVTGLSQGTLYHFRAVGTNANGTTYGSDTVFTTISGTSCQAAFTYVVDSSNYNIIHFIDLSTGNILNWLWNFGDDSTSTLQNPVHTFTGPGTYNFCLAVSGPDCLSSTCQEVEVGSASNCISYFTYTNSGQDVNFAGHLFSGAPAAYNWVFGDGQTGQGQNILHHYSVSGVYYVMLNTIDSTDCQYNSGQLVPVGDSAQYYQIYGQVFAGGVPVTGGSVMLFTVDTVAPYFPMIDVSNLDTTGVYYFGLVPNGNFYLYATPQGNSNYLPAYYGDVPDWQEATIIALGVPDNPYNVNLIPSQNLQSGNGSINGQNNPHHGNLNSSQNLQSGDGTINGQINSSGLKTTLLDKVTLLLLNPDMQAGKFVRANVNGSFTFSSLAYGTYYLRAEIAGVKSDVIMVTLSAANPTCNVVLTFSGVRIMGVHEVASTISAVKIFPNPVNDELHIALHLQNTSNISAELVNTTGQSVITIVRCLSPGDSEITIPVGTILHGLYLLRITSDTGILVTSKIIRQ